MLGAGGMGEVYQARDTKLGRSVALKVLPPAFAKEPDRLARFEREAKLLASLNHPNIAALYGMEESASRHFLVMELVEGETLADRLRRGALPAKDTLKIAHQIAEALEAAHENGIVHRDLKPANVKVTPEGRVKVLDFGLAKAMQPAAAGGAPTGFSNSPTMSMAATGAGVILGTAAYMSPEQASGQPADARSDLFSLGSVLYEMLTGRPPFQGKILSEVLASVLAREPDWSGISPNLHPRIHELVHRCLEKEPRRRWQAAGDVRLEIERLVDDPGGLEPLPLPNAPAAPLRKRAIPVLLTAVVVAVAAALAAWNLKPGAPEPGVARFPFELPQGQTLNPNNVSVAISPDSKTFAYVTDDNHLFLRKISEMQSLPIPGASSARAPIFFSPDGDWIGFWSASESALKKIPATGGTPLQISKSGQPFGVSWVGNQIVWSDAGKSIVRVSESGGEPEVLVSLMPGEVAHGPQILNDGKAVLFTLAAGASAEAWDAAKVVVQPLPSGERKEILQRGSDARYLPSGHLIYAIAENIFAVSFDLGKLETQGSAVNVVAGVMRPFGAFTGAANLSVSASGGLVYAPAGNIVFSNTALAFVDRNGKFQKLPLPPGPYGGPRLSPDQRQIAFQVRNPKGLDIGIYSLDGGGALRNLTHDGKSGVPAWSPDSRRVIFISGAAGMSWQRADGMEPALPLTKAEPGTAHLPQSVSPGMLAFLESRGTVGALSLLALDGTRTIQRFASDLSGRVNAALSRDGRWLAYTSVGNDGKPQVFVQPYPATGGKHQITTKGGDHALWSPDGTQLFYQYSGKLFAVDIRTEPAFRAFPPSELPIAGTVHGETGFRNYDITGDGKQFLVLLPAAAAEPAQIHVVLHWLEELKQRFQLSPGVR